MRELAKIVEDLGYQPILCLDFDIPETEISQCDLRLLHQCKYAIFEITFSNGHQIEVYKASEYGVQSLLVYQVRDERRTPPPGATKMLTTISGLENFGYITFKELQTKISEFLPKIEVSEIAQGPPKITLAMLSVKCKTCGRFFSSGIIIDEKSFATATMKNNFHLCPNGHLHSYNKEDYIVPPWWRPRAE